jgi:hypothetical protein
MAKDTYDGFDSSERRSFAGRPTKMVEARRKEVERKRESVLRRLGHATERKERMGTLIDNVLRRIDTA